MTRLYYDCPIEASHMAKRFGMRFASWHSGKEYELSVILANAGSPIKTVREGQRYVVHPDSLRLLEPRNGDVLFGPCGGELFTVRECTMFPQEVDPEWATNAIETAGWRLIHRNGVAFHWPQREAA